MKNVIWVVLIFVFSGSIQAKQAACEKYLKKINNIKSQQRAGVSVKRSNKLRELKNTATKQWRACEKGGYKKHSYSKKAKLKENRTSSHLSKKSQNKTKAYKKMTRSNPQPFKSNQPVVVKAPYSGKKQSDWMVFYKQPKQCSRPTNTQMFAFCSENRRKQRVKFDQLNSTDLTK